MKKYAFRKQVRNRGCYAEVLFDLIYKDETSNGLVVNYHASHEWEHACKAGINIFYDYFIRVRRGMIEVTIHEIKWLPMDTNNLIVLYACINALLDALGIDIKDLGFDIENESFVLPEVRKVE